MTRWKLTIEYHGGSFSGWQRQEDGVASVQQAVEDAIHGFCQQRITIHVAGRTDAGVHARGQVAHFDLDYGDRKLSGSDLAKALNAHLRPKKVTVLHAEETADDFHARFSAKNKLYIYKIINRRAPPAIEAGLVWHVRRELDVSAMQEAARCLVGHHDFTTFRDSDCQAKSPVRTLDRFEVAVRDCDTYGGREILVYAEGRSFLHHQVRNMVGTLSLVGEGKWQPEDVKAALEARDRRKGGPTAPADGLYLMRVDY
ncbi:MAG TPA: tRNA pseudouridine(38-40) synthase TruA [Alphaproteobacteria bacterium]